ncbi:GNAT family N-acetyltransferase [Rhizobium sp. BK251]|uniref:GNAT family N-acetyltransferase n=1 Tax=Rhizobium sp. BK251 TaxID=2512125 RepID=UPI001404F21B|nr:GNAT family N-acetyltransferase [Rhizobium sp. BK251]
MTIRHLETARLHLRGLLPTDTSFINELIGHEEVRRFLGGPVPAIRRDAVVSSYFMVDEREMIWLAETKDFDQPLGLLFISNHREGEDLELSYQFHPDSWGLGYAIEATKRVLEYALNDMRLERLIAETQSANIASCRLLERLGMKELRRVQRFGAEQVIYTS